MNKYPFKNILLVSDMDGTLLDSSSKVSEQNREAICRFVEGGGLFTVATGRMEFAVRSYLDVLPLNIPAILYNGASIYDFKNERVLWSSCLSSNMRQVAEEAISAFPGIGVTIFHEGEVYFATENIETAKHRVREGFIPIITEVGNIPEPWYKIILTWEPQKLKAVEKFLENRTESFHMVYSEPQFLELLQKDTSKGHALKKLVEMIDNPQICVVAMGDNMNDIEMIKQAGIGIAVENANVLLKEKADICCVHHDLHAVSQVIDWIEKGQINCSTAG